MEYITIYSTKDKNEVAVLERVYSEEGIKYRVDDTDEIEQVKRIQVAERDKNKARELLEQTGYLAASNAHSPVRGGRSRKKWIFIFLAAMIIIIVAIAIMMFMNVE